MRTLDQVLNIATTITAFGLLAAVSIAVIAGAIMKALS